MKKKNHFVRNCRLVNVINRRKFNVLQILLVKKNHRKNVKNELNFLKNITNEKYY